jgi:hypothetical protein
VVYDTSPGTTIRVARGGSLLEGLRCYKLELDEHEMNTTVYVVRAVGV